MKLGLLSLRIVKKHTSASTPIKILTPVVAVLVVFSIVLLLLLFRGVNPGDAFVYFFGFVGTKTGIAEMIIRVVPLLLIGLGIAIASRCSVFNIGAEGQFIIGGIFAAWIGIVFTTLPSLLLILLIFVASFITGGLWGGLAGYLKARFGVNEIIVTIMLNYVALYLMMYLIMGPMAGGSGVWPRSPIIVESAWLPMLFTGTRLHVGIFISMLFVVLSWLLLFKTDLGYKIRAVGFTPKAARYGGVNPSRTMVIVMILSGGMAGIAGAIEVMGIHHCVIPGFTGNYGYTGIAVAALGGLHPIGVVIAAIGFAAITSGIERILSELALPSALVWVVVGLIFIFVMAGEFLMRYSVRRK